MGQEPRQGESSETMTATGEAGGELLAALPREVREGLTEAQRAAIEEALSARHWGRHLINIRFSLPLPLARYYITVVADRERRSGARLSRERGHHPFRTAGNLLFLLITVVTLYGSAVVAALVWSAILEF
jgi:hypothetical protein